jgi:hypothetical protein
MTRADLEKYSTEELNEISRLVPSILGERRAARARKLWANIQNAMVEYWKECGSINLSIDESWESLCSENEIKIATNVPGEISFH